MEKVTIPTYFAIANCRMTLVLFLHLEGKQAHCGFPTIGGTGVGKLRGKVLSIVLCKFIFLLNRLGSSAPVRSVAVKGGAAVHLPLTGNGRIGIITKAISI